LSRHDGEAADDRLSVNPLSSRETVPDQGTALRECTPVSGSKALLDHFPERHRSWVQNTFLAIVRAGASHPDDVLAGVGAKVEADRRQRFGDPDRLERDNLLLARLRSDDAVALATYCIGYERLPRVERDRLRAVAAEQGQRRWMKQLPPTERQLNYLEALGHSGPSPANRLEASRLIDSLVQRRPGREGA
jgi:hypothetical protein